MSSILIDHLVEITEKLELEPVLRYLRSKGILTEEKCDEIRNKSLYATSALRIEVLVNHLAKDEARLQGFLDALRETKQDALLKLINPIEVPNNDDADSGKTPPDADSVKPSERSCRLRAKKWTCEGLPGAGEGCGFVGSWQEAFRWCSHKDCRRYLCSNCIEGEEHKHSSKCRVDVKPLHAAAYERVKKDDAKKKRELCAVAEGVGRKVSEALQAYLLNLWDRQAPRLSFEKHLLVDKAGPQKTSALDVSSNEALAAVTKAVAQMGALPLTEEDVVPSVLKDAEPKVLLARLLAKGGDVKAFLEKLEELEAPPEEQATVAADDETQAMVPEERDDLPDLALIKGVPGGDGVPSFQDIYGKDVKPEHAPPALLKLFGTSILDEEYNYSSSVMSAVDAAGDELLTLRDAKGWTSLHITAGRGATGLIKRLLQRPEVEVDARANDGCTPLMVAVWNDKVAAVRALIKAGAEVTAKDHQLRTAVHVASGFGLFESLQSLLKTFPRDAIDAVNDTGRTALFNAALNGSAECVAQLLGAWADQSIADEDGRAPLHAAAQEGHLDVARLLLAQGPHLVDAQDKEGATPLMLACQNGHVDVAKALLDAGADVEVTRRETGGYAAIHLAAKNGSIALVEELIDEDGRAPLHAAAQWGHLDVARLLLAQGPHLADAQDKEGATPLMLACQNGHVDVAKALLDAGADVEVTRRETGGYAAIHLAAKNGSIALVEELIDRGSPVNFPSNGHSCLLLACLNGHLEVASVLVEKGADAYHVDAGGFSAFSAAAQEGHNDILEFLLARPCNDDDAARRGRCAGEALQMAALKDHLSIVKTLIESEAVRADYSHPDSRPKGNQAIHSASQEGHPAIVEYLLSKGVSPDATNEDGMTPLMCATSFGHVECVRTLLEGGASADLLTPRGTALHMGVRYGQEETTALLLSHTAKHLLEAESSDGFTVLLTAAMEGHTGTFLQLCERGANLGVRMEDGDSCLHLAAQKGHGEIMDFILQREEGRALLNAKGKGGSTACMRAAQQGHVAVAAVLLAHGADQTVCSADGRTALHFAAPEAPDTLHLLLQHSKDNINQRDDDGNAPIIAAALTGNAESVRLLTVAGADLDLANKNGLTALHWAAVAKEGALATVEALIAAGADVHKVDDGGWTCLHFAAWKGNADVVGALLAGFRLSPNAKTNHDSTPLNLAAQNDHPETVAVLLSFRADPEIRDKDGDSPMDCAVAKGHADVVRLLEKHKREAAALKAGGDPKVQSWIGDLPE